MQRNVAFVNLKNIVDNSKSIRNEIKDTKLCAVVKCNAYGHGAIAVSHALEDYCDFFAVALIDEGAELRVSGIGKDILVLQPVLCEEELLRASFYNLIITLASDEDFYLAKNVCEKYSITIRTHIKCNTGMNRLGYDYWQFLNSCLIIKAAKNIKVEGIYSHFYMPEDSSETRVQFNLFTRFYNLAESIFGKLVKHVAATGGIFADKAYRLDMVRTGIALYGYLPRGIRANCALKPALKVYTHAVQGRKYESGGIAYGRTNAKYNDITTLRVGYGDGFFRSGKIGNINNLCMDATVVSEKYEKGALVPVMQNAEAYAKKHNTISYEILCSITRRAEFVYI